MMFLSRAQPWTVVILMLLLLFALGSQATSDTEEEENGDVVTPQANDDVIENNNNNVQANEETEDTAPEVKKEKKIALLKKAVKRFQKVLFGSSSTIDQKVNVLNEVDQGLKEEANANVRKKVLAYKNALTELKDLQEQKGSDKEALKEAEAKVQKARLELFKARFSLFASYLRRHKKKVLITGVGGVAAFGALAGGAKLLHDQLRADGKASKANGGSPQGASAPPPPNAAPPPSPATFPPADYGDSPLFVGAVVSLLFILCLGGLGCYFCYYYAPGEAKKTSQLHSTTKATTKGSTEPSSKSTGGKTAKSAVTKSSASKSKPSAGGGNSA